MHFTTPEILQWTGCVISCAGAFLLALNCTVSGWGFVFFLGSNIIWIAYGYETGAPGLVTTQTIFMITSLLGIYRWFLASRVKAYVVALRERRTRRLDYDNY